MGNFLRDFVPSETMIEHIIDVEMELHQHFIPSFLGLLGLNLLRLHCNKSNP